MRKFFSFVAAAFVALTMNAQAISVADAIAEGMKLDSAATSEAEFVVEGFVINSNPSACPTTTRFGIWLTKLPMKANKSSRLMAV